MVGTRGAVRDERTHWDVFHAPHFAGNDHCGSWEVLALDVCQALHHRHPASCSCLADHLHVHRFQQVFKGLKAGCGGAQHPREGAESLDVVGHLPSATLCLIGAQPFVTAAAAACCLGTACAVHTHVHSRTRATHIFTSQLTVER